MGSQMCKPLNNEKSEQDNAETRCTTETRSRQGVSHETQTPPLGESSRHKTCQKNPGHKGYIAAHKFKIKHLPKTHRDQDVLDVIIAASQLTVRVSVRAISPQRPEFWPGSNHCYPHYNEQKSLLRTGSGMVSEVYKYTDGYFERDRVQHHQRKQHCWCANCQRSNTPSSVWWEVFVDTAAHVVFDETEACETSLRLFYDTKDSPLYIINTAVIDFVNVQRDFSKLKCVTCDKHIGEQLQRFFLNFDKAWKTVTNKYFDKRDVNRMTFIVSHPHGYPKQISLGEWQDKLQTGDFIKFCYTTPTCPGSSGATVQCIGYRWWGRWDQLVHSGNIDYNLNSSGAGEVW
ncbi:hypothetical protein BgiBS90_004044 [Biomphalaria glabrata]|nr:hypothetical protein BgiBS90_004044 [Biomphalaria glabrata]